MDVFSPVNGRTKFPNNSQSENSYEIQKGSISTIITKNGEKKEIMWFDSSLKDDSGKTIGLLAVGQDITLQMKRQRETLQEKTHEAIGNFSEDFAGELDEIAEELFENIYQLENGMKAQDQKIHYLEKIKAAANRTKELSSRLFKKVKKKKI